MRSPRVVLVALVAALLAAGCSSSSSPKATPSPTPVRGGTLVVEISSDPGQLNPAITTNGAVHTASELMYNGLLGRDASGKVVAELAQSWDVEQGGSVYRFHLRNDVSWHDGKPFTSADVKYTFEQVLLKLHARTKASVGPNLDGIDTPDASTVVFRFKHPYGPFLQQLDVTEAPMLPEHVYTGTDPATNPANLRPVGTGPFMYQSYAKGSEIRLVRNPHYFKPGLPYLDAVVERIIPDVSSAVLALQNKEVDFLFDASGAAVKQLQSQTGAEVASTGFNPGGSNCIMTVSFNLDRPILQDLRVRQAVAYALNRQTFVDNILFGRGRVAAAPISSGIPWAHDSSLSLPGYDATKAASLLDAAGWKQQGGGTRVAQGVPNVPDGTKLSIDFDEYTTFSKYGELVRQQLGALGIEVTPKPVETAVFPSIVFTQRNFDTNVISYCNGPDPEIGVRRMFDSAQIGSTPFTNAAGYRSPQVDALFAQASSSPDLTTRGGLYRQIQGIVAHDLPYVWLVETDASRAWAKRCGGFQINTGLYAEAAFCHS